MNLFKSPLSKQTKILSFFPEPAIVVDELGVINFVNDEAQTMLEDTQLITKNIADILSCGLENILSAVDKKLILKLETQNQNTKVIELKTKEIDSEKMFIVTLNDITKSHSLIQNLLNDDTKKEQLNHQKNLLLIKMSNNLKSPLHSIIGFSQAILEGLGGNINEKQEKYLKIIHKNSTELLSLIGKTVELSEVESQVFEHFFKSFDPINTLNSALTDVKFKINEKNLQLNIDTELLEKKTCYCDENIFKKVLTNLLENAVTSCDIGSITVKLSNPALELVQEKELMVPNEANEQSFLMVEVIDTGAGIPSNELPEIFDPYVQVDKNTKKNLLKGLTLGVAKRFVEELNGKIWVKSELMKESNFSFIIPIERLSETKLNTKTPKEKE